MKHTHPVDASQRARRPFGKLALLVLALASAASLQAAVLVGYDMEGVDVTVASSVHADVSASSLTVAGSHVQQSGKLQLSGDLADDYSTWNTTTDNGTDAAGALATSSFFELTITPDAGKMITLDSITFDAVAGTAGPSTRSVYLFFNKTGYSSGGVLLSASTTSGAPLIPYNTAAEGSSYSVDLSGNSAFSNINDAATFRFYIQTPGTFQNLAFDDIIVNGSVTNGAAPAEVFVAYDMEGAIITAPSITNNNVAATNLYPAGSHVEQAGKIQLTGNPSDDFSVWRTVVDNGTDLAGAIDASAYFVLALTPTFGKALSIESLSFDAVVATAGPSTRSFYVMSSRVGPYTVGNELLTASTTSGSPLIPYNTAAFGQNFSIDLSGNGLFTNITDTVFFRIYIQTPGTHQGIAFDDITVKGFIDDAVFEVGLITSSLSGTDLLIGWSGEVGATYGVERRLDLVSGDWINIQSLVGIHGPMSSTNATTDPKAFYRIVIE